MKKQCILLHLRWLPFIALLFFTRASFGQGPTVSGKVTDSTGKGLEGVSILVKGHKKAAITDANGAFTLALPVTRAILVFSAVGYTPQQMTVTAAQHELTVTLSRINDAMQDVIIV